MISVTHQGSIRSRLFIALTYSVLVQFNGNVNSLNKDQVLTLWPLYITWDINCLILKTHRCTRDYYCLVRRRGLDCIIVSFDQYTAASAHVSFRCPTNKYPLLLLKWLVQYVLDYRCRKDSSNRCTCKRSKLIVHRPILLEIIEVITDWPEK